ncbi:MAG: DUF3253 domain-containing protein [Sandaracinaceae bacterium]
MASPKPEKPCRRCGRGFVWRKKWARDWDAVRYCSERCRRTRVTAEERNIEAAIVALLSQRGEDKSICPSEAARVVAPDDWRTCMHGVRTVAARLVATRIVRATQGPREVHPVDAKGPIRLRRGPRFPQQS